MKADLESANGSEITLVGINQVGYAIGNQAILDEAPEGRPSIPWLQDEAEYNVWATWTISYRDLVIVDADLAPVRVYNLSDFGLQDEANYDELFDYLLELESP